MKSFQIFAWLDYATFTKDIYCINIFTLRISINPVLVTFDYFNLLSAGGWIRHFLAAWPVWGPGLAWEGAIRGGRHRRERGVSWLEISSGQERTRINGAVRGAKHVITNQSKQISSELINYRARVTPGTRPPALIPRSVSSPETGARHRGLTQTMRGGEVSRNMYLMYRQWVCVSWRMVAKYRWV